MPVDTGIYSLLKPIEPIKSDPDLVGKMGAAFNQGQKMADGMEQKAKQGAMKEAYGRNMGDDGKMNRAGYLNDLARIDPEKAMQMRKAFGEEDAMAAEAKSKQLQGQIDQMGYIANLTSNVKDQAGYENALASASQMGIDTSKLPKAFDPGLMRGYATNSLKMAERLAAQKQEHDALMDGQKLDFEKTKEKNDVGYKYAKMGQEDRHKMADISGNASLADKHGQQALQQIQARAEEERKTNGFVTADTAAKLAAELKGSGKGANKLTPDQFKVAGFGKRLQQAEDVFGGLEADGFDRTSASAGFQSLLPNGAQGKDVQSQEQAERNYINAVLRRESGAAISPEEFASASKQYFPRYGDSADLIAQKKANRDQVNKTFEAESGGAWDAVPTVAGVGQKQREERQSSGGMGVKNANASDSGMVRMRDPKGNIRMIPSNMVGEAIAAGGSKVK